MSSKKHRGEKKHHDAQPPEPAIPEPVYDHGPATHEVRHHGQLIGHMSEADAHALVTHKIATSGLEGQPEDQQEHDQAWTIDRRKRFAVAMRGNVVDTYDDPTEANQHAAQLREDVAEQDAQRYGGDQARPAPAPHTSHSIEVAVDKDGNPVQVPVFHTVVRMVPNKDEGGRVKRTNRTEPMVRNGKPVTRNKVTVTEHVHTPSDDDPVQVIDSSPTVPENAPRAAARR